MNLSTQPARTSASEVLRRAVGVTPKVQRCATPRGSLDAYYWRTPWLSNYELESSDEIILALHTGGSRTVRTRTPGGWSNWTSGPGQLHIIPARHSAAFKPDGKLEFVTLHFGTERLANLLGRQANRTVTLPFRFAFDDPFANACIRTLCEELRRPSEHGSLFVESLSDTLCLHLLRTSPPPEEHSAPMPSRIARARERIEASVATGISLEELASDAGTSRFHFARLFRDAVGEPPHRYLTRCRIEQAKKLLRRSELTLADIALSVGYSSQSHFTAAFRGLLGRTPRQFRASSHD